ncbi:MAG: 30S ribosomal protein S2 [Candidatus ainarchaeum sp.]|nr:30S ribosomal protein S2 [Candidatus ainarchaeum sp.]
MIEKKLKEKKKEEDDVETYKGKELLIDIETYLKSGIHIGKKFKRGEMRKYIFKKRKDGLMVFNIETIDKRIRMAAKEISKYDPKEVIIVCRKLYGQTPVKKFAKMIGAKAFIGRFVPGTITNPEARSFYEPKIVLICDPISDSQALKEASESHIPVFSLAGSESPLKNVDFVIPSNNKGRKSIALIFYLLTREILTERKEIDPKTFNTKIEDFEQQLTDKDNPKKKVFSQRRRPFKRRN